MASKKELTSDKRFSRITKDPRFWEMPEKDRKIKIDSRFRAMFHDKKFKLKYTVDKRGRPINRTSTEDLKRFYELSDSDSDISETDSKQTEKKTNQKKVKSKGGKSSTKSSVGRQTSKQADEVSSVSQSDILKSDNQKGKSFKSEKDIKRKKATEFPQDFTVAPPKQNNCDEISKDFLCKKSSKKTLKKSLKKKTKKTVKEKAVGNYTNDFSASHVKEAYVKNKSCEVEESSNLQESKSSEESEEEDKLEDNSDLQEESDLGDEGAIREESTSEDDEEDSTNESQTEDDESESGPDLARGKGNLETSSEDEEEDDFLEIFPKDPEVIHEWGELGKDAPQADQVTHRLAVCNMDWDRLKAKDLLALLNSFTPKGGVIFSVKIYPSDFGKQRMKEEKLKGPAELLSLPQNVTEKDSIYKEKLRDYQFKRLKYFYAVVDCDSPETANKIYEECDGLEFESSYSFVDLRFIPDDVTFDDEPKDMASELDVAAYKPKYFTSAAVATSKVDITWDETDQERVTSLSKNFKKDELLDMDFQAYLASSSEEEEEEDEKEKGNDETDIADGDKPKEHSKDEEDQIAKYRELLRSIQEKEKKHQDTDMEMEIKWVPGLKENAEEMVRNKLEGKDNLTPWQQFLEKKKEKRKMKKKQKAAAVKETLSEDECPSDVDLNDPYFVEELGRSGLNKTLKKGEAVEEEEEEIEKQKAEMALLLMMDDDEERCHFNYDKIVEQQNLSKRKKKLLMKKEELVTDDFQVNVDDARFQAMYTSHLYNLDPSDPNFKKTKAVQKILEEKARRRHQGSTESKGELDNVAEKKPVAKTSLDPALSMLVKSIKNKTEQFQARKKQKVK
ncbi:ESF1 homolog [Pantherophis guttatus]|uniref:ESF1 homolog n=1 Tax=Pantherophis guttatus TaxID=94885 RepID=A0A6P9CYB6_PANGU|nr:ESF1 homolog [Pantherophis guttatus]XP_034288287.1 ESF1 homolog [Pantherophis guttatus]